MKTRSIALKLAAVLSLLSAFSVHAQSISARSSGSPVQITYVPFNITAPGTYRLTTDLSFPFQQNAAITVAANLKGPVVVDLGKHTITGIGAGIGIGIGINSTVPNTQPITVQNGTIKNFGLGVLAEDNNNAYLSFITIKNVNFISFFEGVFFYSG
jgi:hypothetical protein